MPVASSAAQDQSTGAVYVEFVTVEVDPGDIGKWESAMADLARVAETTAPDILWLTYRGDPGEYRLVLQAESLAGLPTQDTFSHVFSTTAQGRAAWSRLMNTGFTMNTATVTRQVPAWSTVDGMSTDTHPLAVVTEYTLHPAATGAFQELFSAWGDYYRSIEYPYPVEGFRSALFPMGQVMIVVFPDTWSAYYGAQDLDLLAAQRGQAEPLMRLRDRLWAAVRKATITHLTYVPDLSYDP